MQASKSADSSFSPILPCFHNSALTTLIWECLAHEVLIPLKYMGRALLTLQAQNLSLSLFSLAAKSPILPLHLIFTRTK